MRSMRLLCGALALAACSLVAHADPITFTETATGSGSLNGIAFTNQLLTLTGSGDSANITVSSGSNYLLALTGGTLQIGSTTATFTDGLSAFSFANIGLAGLADSAPPGDLILGSFTSSLSGYTLNSAISATGIGEINQGEAFNTSAGKFVLGITNDSTFTATLGAASTPEPSSLLLLATGIAGTAGMLRRKLRLG